MDPAISTLLGTALGGLLGAGSGVMLERLRADREERVATRNRRLDARQAARLIAEELEHNRRRLDTARERGHYTWGPGELLPVEIWIEHRADFAASATPEEWKAVAAAYVEINRLNEHVVATVEEERWMGVPPGHPLEARALDSQARDYVGGAATWIEAALEQLEALVQAEE